MNPNTYSGTPVFVTVAPDWAQPATLRQSWATYVSTARDGTEQRTALRSFPRYSVAYSRTHDGAAWTARLASVAAELSAPVVVPLWPRPKVLVEMDGDDAVLDVESLEHSPFNSAGWAYFEQSGLQSVFRVVDSVGTDRVTLASGDAAYPEVAPPAYTAGCLVYPCTLGLRVENSAEWDEEQLGAVNELIQVEGL